MSLEDKLTDIVGALEEDHTGDLREALAELREAITKGFELLAAAIREALAANQQEFELVDSGADNGIYMVDSVEELNSDGRTRDSHEA